MTARIYERCSTVGINQRHDKTMEKTNRKLNTPLGELIAAAGQVAFECSDNDKDAYILAQLALIEMIKKTAPAFDMDSEFDRAASPSQLIH